MSCYDSSVSLCIFCSPDDGQLNSWAILSAWSRVLGLFGARTCWLNGVRYMDERFLILVSCTCISKSLNDDSFQWASSTPGGVSLRLCRGLKPLPGEEIQAKDGDVDILRVLQCLLRSLMKTSFQGASTTPGGVALRGRRTLTPGLTEGPGRGEAGWTGRGGDVLREWVQGQGELGPGRGGQGRVEAGTGLTCLPRHPACQHTGPPASRGPQCDVRPRDTCTRRPPAL